MNKFESLFFEKYIPEGQEIKGIIHIHFIKIFSNIFLWLSMGAILPSFLFYYSERIREIIPFFFLEGLLFVIFIKVIYDIFDWYNDVWIITDLSVVQLQRALFKTNYTSIDFDKIEGIEVEQNGLVDKLLKKGTIVIHKFGDDTLELNNAIKPYKGADAIEEFSEESELLSDSKSEHFDVIMDALGGVVENYLEKKNTKSDKELEIENAIRKVKKIQGSIDLR